MMGKIVDRNYCYSMVKRNWWSMKPKGRGIAGSIFSGIDEMFHGTAKQAQVTREEQKRRAVEVGNSDELKKITIRFPKEK
jgi:hypothetical protein